MLARPTLPLEHPLAELARQLDLDDASDGWAPDLAALLHALGEGRLVQLSMLAAQLLDDDAARYVYRSIRYAVHLGDALRRLHGDPEARAAVRAGRAEA